MLSLIMENIIFFANASYWTLRTAVDTFCPWLCPSSSIKPFSHIASFVALVKAMYSTLVVDNATTFC